MQWVSARCFFVPRFTSHNEQHGVGSIWVKIMPKTMSFCCIMLFSEGILEIPLFKVNSTGDMGLVSGHMFSS